MPTDDLLRSIKGARPEDAQIDSALMVGAKLYASGRPVGINESIMRRFVSNLEVLQLPVTDALREVKGELLRRAFIRWADIVDDTIDFKRVHVRAIDIDRNNGGVDFFTYNQGKPEPDAIIFCGIPKHPEDHESLLGNRDIGGLFSNSVYHHDDEGDWQNFKQRLHQLHPKLVFCAGGHDCLSWQEFIGPRYIAVYGEGFDQGFLISRSYLESCEPYLMSVDSPLLGLLYDSNGSVVFNGKRSVKDGLQITPDLRFDEKDLWLPIIR